MVQGNVPGCSPSQSMSTFSSLCATSFFARTMRVPFHVV